jgi:hypothetical protein
LDITSETSDIQSSIADVKAELAMIRQHFRDWRNDMIKIGFLLSIAQVAIVYGFVLLIS